MKINWKIDLEIFLEVYCWSQLSIGVVFSILTSTYLVIYKSYQFLLLSMFNNWLGGSILLTICIIIIITFIPSLLGAAFLSTASKDNKYVKSVKVSLSLIVGMIIPIIVFFFALSNLPSYPGVEKLFPVIICITLVIPVMYGVTIVLGAHNENKSHFISLVSGVMMKTVFVILMIICLIGSILLGISLQRKYNDYKRFTEFAFPDENLRALICENLNKSSSTISQADLVGVKALVVCDSQISDLTGLKYCLELTVLYLNDNPITDISQLRGLTKLKSLYVSGCQIKDISPLKDLGELTDLNIGGNVISDITPLGELTKLSWLIISGNKIRDIGPLRELHALKRLNVHENTMEIKTGTSRGETNLAIVKQHSDNGCTVNWEPGNIIE